MIDYHLCEAAALEKGHWRACAVVEKYRDGETEPYEVIEAWGNILVNAGIQLMLDLLIGAGGTVFSNANARIGVGDNSAAAAPNQTDLQGTSSRRPMEATFPSRSGNILTFRSSFGSGDANFAWREWAIFNAASGPAMLNRRVQDFGTKSGGTWILTATVEIS